MRGRDTHVLFCTTGILLRRLLDDKNLKGITHIIVDEIHERGINEGIFLNLIVYFWVFGRFFMINAIAIYFFLCDRFSACCP